MAARLLGIAVLLPAAVALRGRLTEEVRRDLTAPFKQTLRNLQDVQYYGEISLGGQPIQGILDTGSFELVVFSKNCQTCGIAGRYDEAGSSTYAEGTREQTHSYGSGSCVATDGFDDVKVGSFVARHQSMWLATECQMPLLAQASFHSIVGIGPPGEPEMTAKGNLDALNREKDNFRDQNLEVPKSLEKAIEDTEEELRVAKTKPSMLENFGVTTFSECLGRSVGSPGYLIWNDKTRQGEAGVKQIKVAGNITWGVNVTEMSFFNDRTSRGVACKNGCGAIVDTGTSLFAVPTEIYNAIFDEVTDYIRTRLPPGVAGCSDLSDFPDLTMLVGGQKLSFPPSSYIGSIFGQMTRGTEKFMRDEKFHDGGCQLLMMDLGPMQVTTLGPMIILGMPFFREYYTTFDLGRGSQGRSLFVSQPDDSCEPAGSSGVISQHKKRHANAYTARHIDASKLRVPKHLEALKGRL